MITIRTYSLFLVFFFLVACGDTRPMLSPLKSNDIILALGDSLTYGTGATSETSYPTVLAKLTSREVINAGISGEETSDALLRLPQLLEKYKPQLVIVCLGGNDILRKRPYNQIKENLQKIITMIRQHHAQIILIAVPKPGFSLSPPDFYQELSEENNILVDTTMMSVLLNDSDYKSDYVHLNSQGYQLMAEEIADLLKDRGAI